MTTEVTDRFREKLKNGTVFGIFSKTSDSAFVEAAGIAGLDFIILDMEHGASTLETIGHHIRAALLTGMAPIVRVKGVDHHAIGSVLDLGAVGVQIPNISTVEDAQIAINSARFHPIGERGVCRFVRAANYGQTSKEEYFKVANDTILVLQIEGKQGIENLNSILNLKGIDILFVGPYDLSQSLGTPGEIDSEAVQKCVQKVTTLAENKAVTLGVFADTPENYKQLTKMGFRYLSYSVDVSLFRDSVTELSKRLGVKG